MFGAVHGETLWLVGKHIHIYYIQSIYTSVKKVLFNLGYIIPLTFCNLHTLYIVLVCTSRGQVVVTGHNVIKGLNDLHLDAWEPRNWVTWKSCNVVFFKLKGFNLDKTANEEKLNKILKKTCWTAFWTSASDGVNNNRCTVTEGQQSWHASTKVKVTQTLSQASQIVVSLHILDQTSAIDWLLSKNHK